MPIILAIEPDRRQRRALDAVVHQRVGAELVLADTTEHALEAIGNRMPDLVLVPALLSPQDDAALAAALRVIAAAAHVRTLTIPVLANESKTEAPSGLLSRWRRGRSASQAPDGCDPHVFAEQISAYLAEAAAERAALRRDADEMDDAPAVERPVVDPAILEAAIVEAVSLSHAVANDAADDDRTIDRAFGDQAFAHQTVSNHVLFDYPIAAQPAVDLVPAEQPADAQALADLPLVDLPLADLPLVDYAAATTPIVEHTFVDHEIVERAVVEPPLFAAIETQAHDSLVDAQEEQAVHEDDVNTDDIDLSGELFDGEPLGVVTMPECVEPTIAEPIVVEEIAAAPAASEPDVEEPALAQLALDATVADEVAEVALADEPPVEEVAFDTPSTDELTFDEFVIDDRVVEEFAFEEVAATSAANEPPLPLAIVEPVAPQVLEARAAFEQAEVMALADTDDAVLSEFADYGGPEPDDVEPWISASLARQHAWPALEGVPVEIVIEPVKPEPVRPLAAAATHVREREWTELVASLRQDIERRRVEPIVAKPKRPSKKAKPAQDEWGFFDPEQCGFAALLAKLDEITDPPPDERDRPRH